MKILIVTSILIFLISCMQETVLDNLPPPNSPNARLNDAPEGKTLNLLSSSEAYTNSPTLNIVVKKCPEKSFILFTEKLDKPKKDSKLWESCSGDQTFAYDFNDPITNETKSIFVWAMNKNRAISKTATELKVVYDTISPQVNSITISPLTDRKFKYNPNSSQTWGEQELTINWNISDQNIISGLNMQIEFVSDTKSSLIDDVIISNPNISQYSYKWKITEKVYYTNTSIKITFTDAAGNISLPEATPLKFLVDTIPLPPTPTVNFAFASEPTFNKFSSDEKAYLNKSPNNISLNILNNFCTFDNSIINYIPKLSLIVKVGEDAKPSDQDSLWKTCENLLNANNILQFTFESTTEGTLAQPTNVYIWSKEQYNHISQTPKNLQLIYDKTKPRNFDLSNISASTVFTTNQSQQITWGTLIENNIDSSKKYTLYYLSSRNPVTWTIISNTIGKNLTQYNWTPTISNTVTQLQLEIEDLAGNIGFANSSNFVVDNGPPVIDSFTVANGSDSIAMPYVPFEVRLNADSNDVTHYYYCSNCTKEFVPSSIPVNSWKSCGSPSCPITFNGNGEKIELSGTADEKTIYIAVKDMSGKYSTVKKATIKLDYGKPPKITLKPPNTTGKYTYTGGSINIKYKCEKGGSDLSTNPLPVYFKYYTLAGGNENLIDVNNGTKYSAIDSSQTDNFNTISWTPSIDLTNLAFRIVVYCQAESGVIANLISPVINASDSTSYWQILLGDSLMMEDETNALFANTSINDEEHNFYLRHSIAVDNAENIYFIKGNALMKIDASSGLTTRITGTINWEECMDGNAGTTINLANLKFSHPFIIGKTTNGEYLLIRSTLNCSKVFAVPFNTSNDAIIWNTDFADVMYHMQGYYSDNGFYLYWSVAGNPLRSHLKKIDLRTSGNHPVIIQGSLEGCSTDPQNPNDVCHNPCPWPDTIPSAEIPANSPSGSIPYIYNPDDLATNLPIRGMANFLGTGDWLKYNPACTYNTNADIAVTRDLSKIWVGMRSNDFKYYPSMHGLKLSSGDYTYKILENARPYDDGWYTLSKTSDSKAVIYSRGITQSYENSNDLATIYKLRRFDYTNKVYNYFYYVRNFSNKILSNNDIEKDPVTQFLIDNKFEHEDTVATGKNAYYVENTPGEIYRIFKDSSSPTGWGYVKLAGIDKSIAGNDGATPIVFKNPVSAHFRNNYLWVQEDYSPPKKITIDNGSLNVTTYSPSDVYHNTWYGTWGWTGNDYQNIQGPRPLNAAGTFYIKESQWGGQRNFRVVIDHTNQTVGIDAYLFMDQVAYLGRSPNPSYYPKVYKDSLVSPLNGTSIPLSTFLSNDSKQITLTNPDGSTKTICEETDLTKLDPNLDTSFDAQFPQTKSSGNPNFPISLRSYIRSVKNSSSYNKIAMFNGHIYPRQRTVLANDNAYYFGALNAATYWNDPCFPNLYLDRGNDVLLMKRTQGTQSINGDQGVYESGYTSVIAGREGLPRAFNSSDVDGGFAYNARFNFIYHLQEIDSGDSLIVFDGNLVRKVGLTVDKHIHTLLNINNVSGVTLPNFAQVKNVITSNTCDNSTTCPGDQCSYRNACHSAGEAMVENQCTIFTNYGGGSWNIKGCPNNYIVDAIYVEGKNLVYLIDNNRSVYKINVATNTGMKFNTERAGIGPNDEPRLVYIPFASTEHYYDGLLLIQPEKQRILKLWEN